MNRREFLAIASLPLAAPLTARELGAEGSIQVELKPYHGTPTMFVDGKPEFYGTFWVDSPEANSWGSLDATQALSPKLLAANPAAKEGTAAMIAAAAAQAGIHVYCFDVGHGVEWIGPGPGRGEHYDFSTLEARFGQIVKVDPKAHFHLRVQLETGIDDWWSKLYPDELEVHSNGRHYTQSFASHVWRDGANEFLRAYIKRLSETGLLDRVVAFQVGAGHTGEWVKGETSMHSVCGDYSEPMRRHFREWLSTRYQGDSAQLRAAWDNANVSFETAEVPTADQQLSATKFTFRDPHPEGRVIDYFRCLADLSADAVIDFCHTVKQATGGKKLAGAFYGYLLELAWNGGFFAEREDSDYSTYQRSGHLGLRKVLASPDVDFFASPVSYGLRGIGGDAPSMVPIESARLHGKLVFIEEDSRTHIDADMNYGHANTLAESVSILRRNFASAMVHGQHMWWASWKDNPVKEPAFLPLLRQFQILGAELLDTDRTPNAEVAVLVDDESLFYETSYNYFDIPGIFQQRLWGLAHMGAPFDTCLLQDLVDGRMRPYKFYVFLNAWRLDSARREALARQLHQANRVALWIYAPGYIEDDLSLDHMTDLTGFRFATGERPWGPLVHVTNFTHPATKGLPQDLFWGTNSKLGPVFHVDDPSATILGEVVYSQGNCKPGFALKNLNGWTSIYSAAPNLPAPVLRNLARFAGAHIYNDAGDVIYANRDLLAIHTISGGSRLLRLPAAASEVVDLYESKTVARNTSAFEVELPAASTVFYRLRHGA